MFNNTPSFCHQVLNVERDITKAKTGAGGDLIYQNITGLEVNDGKAAKSITFDANTAKERADDDDDDDGGDDDGSSNSDDDDEGQCYTIYRSKTKQCFHHMLVENVCKVAQMLFTAIGVHSAAICNENLKWQKTVTQQTP